MAVLAGFGGRVQIAMFPITGWNEIGDVPGTPQIVKANKWSVDFTLETTDITSTQGAQVTPLLNNPICVNTKQLLPTVAEITINVEAFYDNEPHPLTGLSTQQQKWFSYNDGIGGGVSHAITPGRTMSVWLNASKPTGAITGTMLDPFWYFKCVLITQVSMNIEAKGIVKLSFTGKNNSPIYSISNI